MTLQEILDNKELTDDTEISLGGDRGSIKLSELRGLRQEVATRDERLTALQTERDSFRTKHDQLAESITSLLGTADKAARRDVDNPPTDPKAAAREVLAELLKSDDPTDALFNDKLFGAALKKVKEDAVGASKQEITRLEAAINELRDIQKQGFEGLTRAQLMERENRWYDINRKEIPNGADGKRLSMKDLREYAVSRNIVVPGTQLLDFDRTLEVLTEPERAKANMTAAEQRGYEKGLRDARAQQGKVLPLFGDRSAGAPAKDAITYDGSKSPRANVSARIAQGLEEIIASGEAGNG